MNVRIVSALLAAATGLAGCSGSAGSVVSGGKVDKNASQRVGVVFSIKVPHTIPASRHRHVISPSTMSASIAVTSGATTVPAQVITCQSNACQGTVFAPVGVDTFVVGLYDGTAGNGNLLSTGSYTSTIAATGNPTISLTFNPVIAGVTIALDPSSNGLVTGTSGSDTFDITASDADGNVVIGPGTYIDRNGNAATLAVANSDTSGRTELSTFDGTSSSAQSTTDATNTVMLSYTGANTDLSWPVLTVTSASTLVTVPSPIIVAIAPLASTSVTSYSGTIGNIQFAYNSTTLGTIVNFNTSADYLLGGLNGQYNTMQTSEPSFPVQANGDVWAYINNLSTMAYSNSSGNGGMFPLTLPAPGSGMASSFTISDMVEGASGALWFVVQTYGASTTPPPLTVGTIAASPNATPTAFTLGSASVSLAELLPGTSSSTMRIFAELSQGGYEIGSFNVSNGSGFAPVAVTGLSGTVVGVGTSTTSPDYFIQTAANTLYEITPAGQATELCSSVVSGGGPIYSSPSGNLFYGGGGEIEYIAPGVGCASAEIANAQQDGTLFYDGVNAILSDGGNVRTAQI